MVSIEAQPIPVVITHERGTNIMGNNKDGLFFDFMGQKRIFSSLPAPLPLYFDFGTLNLYPTMSSTERLEVVFCTCISQTPLYIVK